jgi:outer membrane protein
MAKNSTLAAICGFALLMSAPARAEFKLATVDIERVLSESDESAAKKKELEELSEKTMQKLEPRKKSLEETQAQLKKSKAAPNSKEVEKFRADAREFEKLVKEAQQDLRKESAKTFRTLSDKIGKAIKDYAEENDIQLVLEKSEKLPGPVLFRESATDITDDIIKSINDR